METVKLPSSIKVIHDEVFAGCRSLKEVDMPDVSYIGVKAFWKCKSLKNIINAKAVEEIGNDAFKECYSLKWNL